MAVIRVINTHILNVILARKERNFRKCKRKLHFVIKFVEVEENDIDKYIKRDRSTARRNENIKINR